MSQTVCPSPSAPVHCSVPIFSDMTHWSLLTKAGLGWARLECFCCNWRSIKQGLRTLRTRSVWRRNWDLCRHGPGEERFYFYHFYHSTSHSFPSLCQIFQEARTEVSIQENVFISRKEWNNEKQEIEKNSRRYFYGDRALGGNYYYYHIYLDLELIIYSYLFNALTVH